jgi:BMFP domain-containing protein YqiC
MAPSEKTRNMPEKVVDAALAPPKMAQAFAASIVGAEGREQLSRAAHDVMEWSTRNRERVLEMIRAEVRSQLKQLGLASREELEALRKRVRELEKTRTATKPVTATSSARKRSTAKHPGTKAAAARRA